MVVRGGWLIIPTEAANASSTQLITNIMSADPFRGGSNKIVLCETIRSNGEPDASNLRQKCKEAMDQIKDLQPWFGLGGMQSKPFRTSFRLKTTGRTNSLKI